MCKIENCFGRPVKTGLCSPHYKMKLRGDEFRPIRKYTRGSVAERIEANSIDAGECKIWTGDIQPNGYGRMTINSKKHGVHRALYEFTFGNLPTFMDVHHECENKLCVNITHLKSMHEIDHIAKHPRERDALGRYAPMTTDKHRQ